MTKKVKPAKEGAAALKGAQRRKPGDRPLAVGARLKTVREQAGMSQRELAKQARVTNVTISLIEQESHTRRRWHRCIAS